MTKIDELMRLADEYAAADAKYSLENMYGTSKSYTANCKEEMGESRSALRTALEAALKPGEPEDSDRVMTVVYRDPTKDEVQSFMDHPKAVWFGWCHAPYQRDRAMQLLEAAPPAQTPPPRLTDEEMVECVRSVGTPPPMGLVRDSGPYEIAEPKWFLIQLTRAIESVVRKQFGVNDD